MSTKIDQVIKKLEEQEAATAASTDTNIGDQGVATGDTVAATAETPEAIATSVEVDISASADASNAQDVAPAIPDFDREGEFQQLKDILNAPVIDPEPVKESEVELPEELKEVEQSDYKELLREEMKKRIAAEKDAREWQATAKHLETINEKTSDKHFTFVEKLKDLESELRRAKSAAAPEKIAPVGQSYVLWQESQTPVHRYRFLKQVLDLAEEVTGISANDYWQKVLQSENKDVPTVEDQSPTASVPEADNK